MLETSAAAYPTHSWFARNANALVRCLVIALLLLLATEIVLSTSQESQTQDESSHLFAGYEYWMHGDFGRNPEHPPLVKLVAAAGLLGLRPVEPPPIPTDWFKLSDSREAMIFLYGRARVPEGGVHADALLLRGRAMMLLFTLTLGFVLFAATREMFGVVAGLIALGIFATEPMILANGGLIMTDMALSCTMFCSVYALYRYVKVPTAGRLVLVVASTALTLAVKHSGIFVVPILFVLAAVELWLSRRQSVDTTGAPTRDKLKTIAIAVVTTVIVSYGILWAVYGFRYAARPAGLQMTPTLDVYADAVSSHAERAIILFCAHHRLLPEAYLYGWADILQIPGARNSYLLGKFYVHPEWYLFPTIILLKSTIPLLLLFGLIPVARLWQRSREFWFLLLPAAIYLSIVIASGMYLQARYVLPIYPSAIALAAATAWHLARRSRGWAVAVAALAVFAIVSSAHAYPDYLAFVNEAAGGPGNSYRVVTDSNGDYAQGLKWARQYLDNNHITDCWFDYNEPFVDPKYYGIGCRPLMSGWLHGGAFGPGDVPETISGTVLISAQELDGISWGPDELNPYAAFRHREPDARIGNVILVYRGTFHIPLGSAYSHLAAAGKLIKSNRMQDAVAEADEAVRLAPDSADIQAGLGTTLMAAGRPEEARAANTKALRLARTVRPEFQQGLIKRLHALGINDTTAP